MDDHFNIFSILSKDDKELIHSAFIKFLISEDKNSFFTQVLDKNTFVIEDIKLEKSYTLKSKIAGNKNRRCRIDIEIPEKEGNEIVVIENKFKSFPYPEQLELYDEIYSQTHPSKKISKYLLCFDKNIVNFEMNNWKFIEYTEILEYLETAMDVNNVDKQTFIDHYIIFLRGYQKEYEKVKKNCSKIFSGSDIKPRYSIENKFWMNLIYSHLRLDLIKYFDDKNIDVKYRISPGNTSTPLINILPQHWKFGEKGRETLIQFQGDLIKFYCHTNDPEFLEIVKLKAHTIESLKTGKYKFKPEINNNPKSRYIFQVKLTDLLQNPRGFNVKDLSKVIVDLYHQIDKEIMAPSSNQLESLQLTTAEF